MAVAAASKANSSENSLSNIKDVSKYAQTKEVLASRLKNPKLDPKDKALIKEYIAA
jgi:hypothetical protein